MPVAIETPRGLLVATCTPPGRPIYAINPLAVARYRDRIRPYRPQTNGKVERFNRTLLDEWAYAQPYTTEAERRQAFGPWLHHYNHHRRHTALGGHPPASRVPNLTGQNS